MEVVFVDWLNEVQYSKLPHSTVLNIKQSYVTNSRLLHVSKLKENSVVNGRSEGLFVSIGLNGVFPHFLCAIFTY